jgi:OmpA-OmpF porin, OOP family
MNVRKIGVYLGLVLLAALVVGNAAHAENLLNEDWVLDTSQSHLYMQTEKLEHVVERQQFTSFEGSVSKDGDAVVKIDLGSLETGIDLRNVRMRFLLFETYKFPTAEITTRLDKAKLAYLDEPKAPAKTYSLTFNVNLHGVIRQIPADVFITRVNDTTVSVTTANPIMVSAETFDLTQNIAKLSDAVGGIHIVPSVLISFDLTFGAGAQKQKLDAARAEREQQKTAEAAQTITAEGCETRLDVISQTGAIYFKTGSAELDQASEPLLNSGADIAKRCPSVKFDVEGHTDDVGGARSNQRLSEQRAKSVVDYLTAKGVDPARIHSAGFGESRPVVPNDSAANRAKNRRIEFKVIKN